MTSVSQSPTKRCSRCGETKPVDMFYRQASALDGLQSRCKVCTKDRNLPPLPKEKLPDGLKRCAQCAVVKPFSAFTNAKQTADGLYSYCRNCVAANRIEKKGKAVNQCPICGNTFIGSDQTCSIQCRNTMVGRIGADKKRITVPPPAGKRFSRRPCLTCGKISDRVGDFCQKCKRNHNRLSDEIEQFIAANFPDKGAGYCARALGKTVSSIQGKAYKMGLTLSGIGKSQQYANVRRYMILNNPMRNPETVQKVKGYWLSHPDEWQEVQKKLNAGKGRHMRLHPSKLEGKCQRFLEELDVSFEAQFVIKDKFIVDFKIAGLIIQVDGEYWHGHARFEPLTERQLAQKKRDKAQDAYLHKCGYTVIRIWERDVTLDNIRGVLEKYGVL